MTVVASLLSPAGKAQNAFSNARRHATAYLDSEYTPDPAERERIFQALLEERDTIMKLPSKYHAKARDEIELMQLLARARDSHDEAVRRGESQPDQGPHLLK